MNKKELGNRILDFVLGTEVEGTVSAVLPSQINLSRRYAISTKDGILDTHFSAVTQLIFLLPLYYPRPEFRRGEKIKERAVRVRPWINGQRV